MKLNVSYLFALFSSSNDSMVIYECALTSGVMSSLMTSVSFEMLNMSDVSSMAPMILTAMRSICK